MLNIKWNDKKTNDQVLTMVDEQRTIMSVIRKRHKKWIGHILRGNTLLKMAIDGYYIGKFKKGRRESLLTYLKIGQSYEIMKRRAENREAWRCWTPT